MRHWEDIVREKMEGFEKPLPEGSLARFHARRDGAAKAPEAKRFPILWVSLATVAAGLAAVVLLRQPIIPDGGIQIIRQPEAPVAAASDSTDTIEPTRQVPLISHVVTTKANRQTDKRTQNDEAPDETEAPEEKNPIAQVEINPTAPAEAAPTSEQEGDLPQDTGEGGITIEPLTPTTSPFIPKESKTVTMDVLPAAISVASGGSLAALATAVAPLLASRDYQFEYWPNGETLLKRPVHYMPLKAGVSVRFPISDRLSITGGLDYSLYLSQFSYKIAGNKNQSVHYLGVPLRLDVTLASNKWLDVYLGGGLKGDYCVTALQSGEIIDKDKFVLSVNGVGGIQFNVTDQLGVYLEPEISCTLARIYPVSSTYRSENPIMFSVNSGIRFTIGK